MASTFKSFWRWLCDWIRDHSLWKLLELAYDQWIKKNLLTIIGGWVTTITGSWFIGFQWHVHWQYLVMIGGLTFAVWIAVVGQKQHQENREELKKTVSNRNSIVTDRANTRPLIQKITFNYLPDGSPLAHGWELTTEKTIGTLPKITSLHDNAVSAETIMLVESQGSYGLDYSLPHVTIYDGIRFTARFADGGVLYMKLRIWTPDGRTRIVWLAQVPLGGTVPHGDGSLEWKVSQPTEILSNGWILFDLSISDQMKTTFRCPKYQLLGVRLRGSLAISSIEFFGPRTLNVAS